MKAPASKLPRLPPFMAVLLLMLFGVSHALYIEMHNMTLPTVGSYADLNVGEEILMKGTYNLTSINQSTGANATVCKVQSYDGLITYFTGSFTGGGAGGAGGACSLNMQLNSTYRYRIVTDSAGAATNVGQKAACGAACTNISDSIINWTSGLYSGTYYPTTMYNIQNLTFIDSAPTGAPFIAVLVSLPIANETEARIMGVTINAYNGNLTSFNISATYNNTVISNTTVGSLNTSSYLFNLSVTAPLVASNSSINYTVSVTAIQNLSNVTTGSVSDYQNVSAWYTPDRYNISGSPMVEATVPATITWQARPPNASADVAAAWAYQNRTARLYMANGTDVNSSAYNLTTSSGFLILFPSIHAGNTYVFADNSFNQSYNLSFNATNESISRKSITRIVNATREYYTWLVNSTNYSVNGTLINGSLAGLNMSNAFNMSFYDELTQAPLSIDSATMSYVLLFTDGTTKTFSVGYSGSGAVASAIVRGYPNFYTTNLSSIESYAKATYATRNRFMLQSPNSMGGQTNVSVYLLALSSATYGVINVVNSGLPVEGAYVQVMKYYTTNGLYTNVDQEITDANGRAAGYYDVGAYYKFAVYDSSGNQLYFSPNPQKFIVSNSIYQVTIDISTSADLNFITPYVRASCEANNATNVIVCNYMDYSGKTNTIDFLVWRSSNVTGASWSPVCNYTVAASSASYTCNLTAVGENMSLYMYTAVVRRQASPWTDILWRTFDFRIWPGVADWGILAIMVILDAGAVGAIVHPAAGMLLAVVALAALSFLGYISIVPGVIASLVVVVGIVIYLGLREG